MDRIRETYHVEGQDEGELMERRKGELNKGYYFENHQRYYISAIFIYNCINYFTTTGNSFISDLRSDAILNSDNPVGGLHPAWDIFVGIMNSEYMWNYENMWKLSQQNSQLERIIKKYAESDLRKFRRKIDTNTYM